MILPIVSILITAGLLVRVFLNTQQEIYDKDKYNTRVEIIKNTKTDALQKVDDIVGFVEANVKILKDEAKLESKNMIHFAYDTIKNVYKENEHLPKEKILQKIYNKLREMRFFKNLDGYFFIYDLNGKTLMHPIIPSLEGKNLIGMRDAVGKEFIKEGIDMLKKDGEGKLEWFWSRSKDAIPEKKYGYMKVFEPLNIFVGTGRYENDVLKEIKKEIQKLLINTKYGKKGYIFAFDYKGNVISHSNKDVIGKNRWNVVVGNELTVQNIIKGSRLLEDGFFMTYISHQDPITKKEAKKTSFVKNIPDLSWVIGTGIYYADILEKIGTRDVVLKEKLDNAFNRIILIAFFVLSIVTVITFLIFWKLKKTLKSYQEDLIEKHLQTVEHKKKLLYQLEHDHLTKLPNRILFSDRLIESIKKSKRNDTNVAVLFIDIDKFKTINDSMGHDIGDEVLKEVALRFKSAMRESDVVARFGGDEFVVLIDDYKNAHDIIKIIDKIQKALVEPIVFNDSEYKSTISIGISVFPHDGDNPQSLLKNADIAMYRAKEDGRNRYKFFTKHMNEELQAQIDIEKTLSIAIQKKEFVLHYQPLVDANNDEIVAVEALIRWQHPTRGLVYPDEFISIAEESGLIVEIGEWVIDEAMNQIVKWKEQGYAIEKMAINIASRQLESSNLIDYIKKAMKRTSCKAEWLEFEIVERYIMKHPEKSIKILNRLRDMGIDIAIDDFGTGYSSLSYLKNLPVTKLKIDRAFIKNLEISSEDRAIAKTIIALGNGLFMKVLGEGIEYEEQRKFLMEHGCSFMQGYLFSKPLPADKVEKLL